MPDKITANLKKLSLTIIALTVSAALQAAETADTLRLSEVDVTAIKSTSAHSAESSSMSTINRIDVERLGITAAREASIVAPNFYIPDYGSRMTSTIYVRGIGARIDQPVVGMNVDNISIINKDNYDFDIPDIESIEIVRGPQSTLYGRNTMGGIINVRTLSPLSYQGTRLLAEYGSRNSLKAALSHYNRPSERFGIGASAFYRHSDGFFTNEYNGKRCDGENYGRAAVKLQWRPTESWHVENSASATIVRQGGYAYEFAETGKIAYNDTCYYDRTTVMDGLTAKWKGNGVSVASITSYQYIDDNMTLDQDFLPLDYFTLTQKRREHAVTQDVVVRSERESRIRWLAGAFAFYKRSHTDAPVTFKDYGISNLIEERWNSMNPEYPIGWDTDRFTLGSTFTMPSYGVAAYAEASAELSRWTITAGLRYDYEHTRLSYLSDCSTGYTIYHGEDVYGNRSVEIHNRGSLSRSFDELLPRLSVSYRLDTDEPCNLYASIAKGYKAGGFNTQMFSDVLQQEMMGTMGIGKLYDIDQVVGYKPEKSWNYEIGGHFKLVGGRLSIDASAFYIDCRDQQLTVFPEGTTTGRIMANAGKTRSLGGEITVRATPVNRLLLTAAYGYTNARFVDFSNGINDYSDKRVPYAPENTINASAQYSLSVGDGLLRYITFSADASAVGKIYWNEQNDESQDIYCTLDAAVRLSGKNYSLSLWGRNITDTRYSTFYFVSIQHEFLQRAKPARFGATLRYNF